MVESPASASGDETVRDSPAQESMSRSCPVLPIPSKPPGFVPGYHFNIYASSCRLHRRLVSGFVRSVCSLATRVGPRRILEVGCGPGELAVRLLAGFDASGPAPQYFGLDVSTTDVICGTPPLSQGPVPRRFRLRASLRDSSFDLVVVCETLEHLAEPSAALAEAPPRLCRLSLGQRPLGAGMEPGQPAARRVRPSARQHARPPPALHEDRDSQVDRCAV